MKKVLVLAIFSMVLGWCCLARATAPTTCLLTGTLADIYGVVGAPYRVHYKSIAVQNAGSNIIPGASACSVVTDNAGNLPATGTCTSFVQNSIVQVQVGSGPPVQIQIPTQSSADLSTLILANTDPPSIVSQISIGAGGDYVLTVTNPSAGTVGQAILGPGNVTGIQGHPVLSGTFAPQLGNLGSPTATWSYFLDQGSYTVVGPQVFIYITLDVAYVSGGVGNGILYIPLPTGVPTPYGTPGFQFYPAIAGMVDVPLTSSNTYHLALANQYSTPGITFVEENAAVTNVIQNMATTAATVTIYTSMSYRWY